MKVLCINNIFYRKGGSESVFFNTAELLRRNGNEVRMFSISGPLNVSDPDSTYFSPELSGLKKAVSYFYNGFAAKALERLLAVWKPDIAHIHLIWGGLSPSIIKVLKKYDIPVVHTAHDYRLVCPAYTFRNFKGDICRKCRKCYWNCILNRCSKGSVLQSTVMAAEMRYRRLFHYPVRNIDAFIFVSNFSLNMHIEQDRNYADVKSVVLHNCTKPIMSAPSSGYFLFSGRLSREKGVINLINAFKQVPSFRLMIAGTGPEENEVRRIAADCRNIEFVGHLDRDSLFRMISCCSYVVVPSECYENNPMSIIESYAASKPVIASRIGGIPEIVVEGVTGFLFDSADPQAIIAALKACPTDNSDEYKMLCSNAFKFYQKEFSEQSYYEKLLSFYNTVINEY